jgi:hypothetical protein
MPLPFWLSGVALPRPARYTMISVANASAGVGVQFHPA